MATKTSFGSQTSSFGGFSKAGQGEGALQGVTEFSGSKGITQGGSEAISQTKGVYNKEFGMRLTKDQVKELKAAEADFNSRLGDYEADVNKQIAEATKAVAAEKSRLAAGKADAEGKIGTAQGQIKEGWGKLQSAAKQNTVGGLFDYWWKSADKVPVRVVNGNKVEGTYVMPRDAAKNILAQKGINASWVDGGKRVNIEVNQGGRVRGQELHDALRVGTSKDSMISEFNKNPKVHEAIAKNRAELAKATAQLRTAERQLKAAEGKMRGAVAEQEGNIKNAEFKTGEMGKARDREVSGAKKLAARQKEKRGELYQKWQDARAKAYQVLQNMEVK